MYKIQDKEKILESGIYFLKFNEDKFYIGASENIHQRWLIHKYALKRGKKSSKKLIETYQKDKLYPNRYYIPVPEKDLELVEQAYLDEWVGTEHCLNTSKRSSLTRRRTSVPIHQYDVEGNFIKTFKSHSAASKETGIPSSNIVQQRRERNTNISKSAGGFLWCLEKHDKIEKRIYPDERNGEYDYWVCKYTLDGCYIDKHKNATQAARQVTTSNSTFIVDCLNGIVKHAYGFQWKRINKKELIPLKIEKVETVFNKFRKIGMYSKSGELLNVFENGAEAVRILNFPEHAEKPIHRVCKNALSSYKKYLWKYIN